MADLNNYIFCITYTGNTDLANINSALSTYENGTATIASAYSEIVTKNQIAYRKRGDGLILVYGSFVLGSEVPSTAPSKIFELNLPVYPLWITIINFSTQKSYRMYCLSDGLYEHYTTYPAGEYIISPFIAFT